MFAYYKSIEDKGTYIGKEVEDILLIFPLTKNKDYQTSYYEGYFEKVEIKNKEDFEFICYVDDESFEETEFVI